MKSELFEAHEWEYFLGNAIGNVEAKAQFPKWATEDRREAFLIYASIFGRVVSQLSLDNKETWAPWYADMACERNFPQITKGKLSSFQKVLLVQVFRPDRVESSLTVFVCEGLGISNISSQTLSLKNIYREDSSPEMPILFVNLLQCISFISATIRLLHLVRILQKSLKNLLKLRLDVITSSNYLWEVIKMILLLLCSSKTLDYINN